MKFERTAEYEGKLFLEALDEKYIVKDAHVIIMWGRGKLKAWCNDTHCYLQFPNHLRTEGEHYLCDAIEVPNKSVNQKYYRAMKGSIRKEGSNEVLA